MTTLVLVYINKQFEIHNNVSAIKTIKMFGGESIYIYILFIFFKTCR